MAIQLITLARQYPPPTWEDLFREVDEVLASISTALARQATPWLPRVDDVFTAFHLTPLPAVSVVAVGQDPYPTMISHGGVTVPRATGLSFSVRMGDTIPPSLVTIFRELEDTIPGWVRPGHGNLEHWARQGVLLLNRALTIPLGGKDAPHAQMWEEFIVPVINAINKMNPRVIYLLWGRSAQKLKSHLSPTNIIFEAGHPSSMNRQNTFRGCNHFRLVNEELARQGRPLIRW